MPVESPPPANLKTLVWKWNPLNSPPTPQEISKRSFFPPDLALHGLRMNVCGCLHISVHSCVFRSTNARMSAYERAEYGGGNSVWPRCLALMWENSKTNKQKKKNRHKWQMAILVALQCCSPLAYIKTFFFWFAPVELFCLVCPWK